MALEPPIRSSSAIFMPLNAEMSNTGDLASQSLRPTPFSRPQSAHLMSPLSDIVGPSPVTSNGTETTEIEDDASSETGAQASAPDPNVPPQLRMLKTNISDAVRQTLSEEAVSVIHAPENFHQWASPNSNTAPEKPADIISPPDSVASIKQIDQTYPTPPPITTNVKPVRYSLETATPLAQNLQDVMSETARLRSSSASSLELIPETQETDGDGDDEPESAGEDRTFSFPIEERPEVVSLQTALNQSWTLCNTLAGLSSTHREKVFNSTDTPDAQEKAWKACWKLCQNLYHGRNRPGESYDVRTNLDLCRDFCQALFDVRQRTDDAGDSVLRVSFELNNHLYSAQDSRNLPEAFRERTLDFYITLCHRLMKQRGDSEDETDSLLRACWSLAEMLFSLRQNARNGKGPDEDLLSSANQACWELMDIFREGYTKVRPDRGTPRPSQVNFFQRDSASDARSTAGSRVSMHSKRESLKGSPDNNTGGGDGRSRRKHVPPPETPVTEFEDISGDTPISAGSTSPSMPNILVLGPQNPDNHSQTGSRGGRWSSSASNMSSYSQSSHKTSSTATTATSAEDVNVTRIKVLMVKAAMNVGFNRNAADDQRSSSGKSGVATSLQSFVKSLPTGSFGSLPAHATLLQKYKELVLADNAFRQSATLPSRGRRVHASDLAKSVGWMMMRSGQYSFLRDLFKLVFGFSLEEAESRKSVSIAI